MIKGKKILKNGAVGGYVKQSNGSFKWRIIKGPSKVGGNKKSEMNNAIKNRLEYNIKENSKNIKNNNMSNKNKNEVKKNRNNNESNIRKMNNEMKNRLKYNIKENSKILKIII